MDGILVRIFLPNTYQSGGGGRLGKNLIQGLWPNHFLLENCQALHTLQQQHPHLPFGKNYYETIICYLVPCMQVAPSPLLLSIHHDSISTYNVFLDL